MPHQNRIHETPIVLDWNKLDENGFYVDIIYVTFQGETRQCTLKKRFFRGDAYYFEPTPFKLKLFCKVRQAEKVETLNTFVGIKGGHQGKSYFEEYLKSKINS